MSDLEMVKEDKAVIILDGLNFLFYEWEIEEALFLWESNVPWGEIVERIRPNVGLYQPYDIRETEVAMLFIHLGLEGRLSKRPGAIYGIRLRGGEGYG